MPKKSYALVSENPGLGQELQQLQDNDQWTLSESGVESIERVFGFESIETAKQFIDALTEEVEKHDHHPKVAITVQWSTHYKKALTNVDIEMAKLCSKVASKSLEAQAPNSK